MELRSRGASVVLRESGARFCASAGAATKQDPASSQPSRKGIRLSIERKKADAWVDARFHRLCLEPAAQADHDRPTRIEQAVCRVRVLLVGAPLCFVEVDHIDRELRNPGGQTEHLAEIEAGRKIPLR